MALRNAIGALLGALALGAVFAAVLTVSGCDVDSAYEGGAVSTNAEDPNALVTTRIVGSVGDGPIVNARLRVYSNSGQMLTETRSSNTADYSITVKTQGRNYPLTIVADEGIDLVTGGPPDFSLVSVIMGPGSREVANLNPYGTLIVKAAQKGGGISSATIAAATEAVMQRYGFGLDTSLVAHPISTPMDNTNVHVVVKASETMGEMIRRTRDAVATVRNAKVHGDEVVEALASDLVDGWIDGRGATGHDRRVAAVANVASAAVMVEAMANRLHVYGNEATAAMDQAIWLVRPDATARTQDVGISPEALAQSMRSLHAAMQVTSDTRVPGALYAVQTTQPGSTQMNSLPSGVEDALNLAILDTAWITDASQLDHINHVANSDELPDLGDPGDGSTEQPPSDEGGSSSPDPIVNAPEEEEEQPLPPITVPASRSRRRRNRAECRTGDLRHADDGTGGRTSLELHPRSLRPGWRRPDLLVRLTARLGPVRPEDRPGSGNTPASRQLRSDHHHRQRPHGQRLAGTLHSARRRAHTRHDHALVDPPHRTRGREHPGRSRRLPYLLRQGRELPDACDQYQRKRPDGTSGREPGSRHLVLRSHRLRQQGSGERQVQSH
jgi:hypothetical protein